MSYSIDDGDQVVSGLSEDAAKLIAQGWANARGRSVYYYVEGDDSERVEVRPETRKSPSDR